MSDLPDYTKQIAVNSTVVVNQSVDVKPKGGVLEKGSVASTGSYATVASHVVTNAKQFQLAKIIISSDSAIWIKYRWNGTTISCERLMDDKTLVIEHFPLDYYQMLGDGIKAFDVQIKQNTITGTVNCEIVGEEIAV